MLGKTRSKNLLQLITLISVSMMVSGCAQTLISPVSKGYNVSDFTFPDDWASNGDAYVLTIYTTQKNLTTNSKRDQRVKKSLKSVIRQYGSVINNDSLYANQFALHPIDPGQVSVQGIQSLGKASRIITRLNNNEVCPSGKILMLWFYADTMGKSSGYLSCEKKILSYSDATQLTAALRSGTNLNIPINPVSFFQSTQIPEYVASIPKRELIATIPTLPTLTEIQDVDLESLEEPKASDLHILTEITQPEISQPSDNSSTLINTDIPTLPTSTPAIPTLQLDSWAPVYSPYYPLSFLAIQPQPSYMQVQTISTPIENQTSTASPIVEENDLSEIIKKIEALKRRIAKEKDL